MFDLYPVFGHSNQQTYFISRNRCILTGSGKTFVARRLAEYLIKTKRRNTDRISEEFVCLFNFIEDHYAIETFFDNLILNCRHQGGV